MERYGNDERVSIHKNYNNVTCSDRVLLIYIFLLILKILYVNRN